MNIYIIRHAESEENAGTSASNDAALTPRGREQARRTGHWLSNLELRPRSLFVSPALRTLETADLIRESLPVDATVDPDLCEHGLLYGDDGLSGAEIETRFGRDLETRGTEQRSGYRLPADFTQSHGWARDLAGETKSDFVERALRVIERYGEGFRPGSPPIALVTHAHFGGFLLGTMLDIPSSMLSRRRMRQLNCGVTRIEFTESYRIVHFSNATAHLGDLVVSE
ncbi:MAG: histidine phosphatase family protein [Spirochaetaceae bacterium]|nr:MAG: histidine phosphatase family protein [Spirochaetaceae bacterium]